MRRAKTRTPADSPLRDIQEGTRGPTIEARVIARRPGGRSLHGRSTAAAPRDREQRHGKSRRAIEEHDSRRTAPRGTESGGTRPTRPEDDSKGNDAVAPKREANISALTPPRRIAVRATPRSAAQTH